MDTTNNYQLTKSSNLQTIFFMLKVQHQVSLTFKCNSLYSKILQPTQNKVEKERKKETERKKMKERNRTRKMRESGGKFKHIINKVNTK